MSPFIKALSVIFIVAIVTFGCKSNEPAIDTPDEPTVLKEAPKETSKDVVVEKRLKTISGIVKDTEGNPLIGANILEVGTSNGAITDLDGSFTLSLLKEETSIKLTYIGYKDKELEIGDKLELNIEMEASMLLDEVVVIDDGSSRGSVTKTASIKVTGAEGSSGDVIMSSPPPRSEAAYSVESSEAMTKSKVARKRGESSGPGRIKDELPQPKAGQLTAAEWNDLNNWDAWKELLNNNDYNEMQGHWQLYPRTRYAVFLKNEYELPIQDAVVELVDREGSILWTAHTDNAGRAELWADMTVKDNSFETVDARVTFKGKTKVIKDLNTVEMGMNNITVEAACATNQEVDVMFVVDATGSMGDEIAYLQTELKDVINRSMASNKSLEMRTGAVFYRDSTDAYVTQRHDLSENHDATLAFIAEQNARGGGDYPEAVDAALADALDQDWSPNAVARIIFLLLDAPPHRDAEVVKRIQDQVEEAASLGIKIIPITASGINRQTEFLMKFMAIATNGTYVFITDHSGIGNPHLDPVVKDYEVEKLNDLMVRLMYHYTKSNGCNPNESTASEIKLYPNPASDFVSVDTDEAIEKIEVLSNSGKLVNTITDIGDGQTKVDLSGLVDGVYTIQCTGPDLRFVSPVVVVSKR